MTQKESITWWAELVRDLRPDEPWVVEPDTVVISDQLTAVMTHCWATFTFKTFGEFVLAVTEVYNRIEAYHAGEDHITVEIVHGRDLWQFTLDLCVREAGLTRSLSSILEEAPSDGDGAVTNCKLSPEARRIQAALDIGHAHEAGRGISYADDVIAEMLEALEGGDP